MANKTKGLSMIMPKPASDPQTSPNQKPNPNRDPLTDPESQAPRQPTGPEKTEERSQPSSESRGASRQADYHRIIRGKEVKPAQLTAQYNDLIEQSVDERKELADEFDEYGAVVKKLNNHIRDLNKTNKALQTRIAISEQRRNDLEALVLARQENALTALVADRGYSPKEDRWVRDELAKLGEKMRSWARKYSVPSSADLQDVEDSDKNEVIKALTGYTFHSNWESLHEDIQFPPSKVPALLVQALLAKHVFGRMFVDPFFIFTKFNDHPNEADFTGVGEIYNMMLQGEQPVPLTTATLIPCDIGHEADAHTWRSQTLRNLLTSSDTAPGYFVREKAQSICSELVEEYLSGPVDILLRPIGNDGPVTQRRKDLLTLYDDGAKLALSLWSQRSFLTCQSQEELPIFSGGSPMMSAHRLHQLDDDDRRMDGRKVILFVQPAIIAFGSENAENYDQSKVWAAAVVVVGEKDH